MIPLVYKRRRILGTFLGAALAAALLPGISLMGDEPPAGLILCACVFLCVNQLIYSYPNAIRKTSLGMLEVLTAIGILQDTLIWLLVSWISSQLKHGAHVDGFLPALLGGVIIRASVLACMTIGPQPAEQAS